MGVGSLRRSLSISLLVHFLLLMMWTFLLKEQTARDKLSQPTWIQLPPQEKEVKRRQRIVQTSPEKRTATAKSNSFLSSQNQTVHEQTVSRQKMTTIGSGSPPSSKVNKTGKNDLSKLGVPLFSQKSTQPQKDEPEWATPGLRPQDYVKGMKESDRTALNTREFVFYGYFQRIRLQLDQAWIPILKEKLIAYYRLGRHLASDMDHTTRVLVVLNDKGEITRVQILSESGTKDLDEAAVRAFNRAGPFPNPPKGIIDANNEVRIPWDFVLKT